MDNNDVVTKKDLADLKTGLNANLAEVETRIVDRLTELIRDVETKLLTSFHGYGRGQSALETHRGPGAH